MFVHSSTSAVDVRTVIDAEYLNLVFGVVQSIDDPIRVVQFIDDPIRTLSGCASPQAGYTTSDRARAVRLVSPWVGPFVPSGRSDDRQPGNDRTPHFFEPPRRLWTGRSGHDRVHTHRAEFLGLSDNRVGMSVVGNHDERGHLNLVWVPADVVAVSAQHLELVRERRRVAEDVACFCVLRNEPERLSLATASDEDPGPGRAHRCRRAEGLRQLVVLALVRPVLVAPHLFADLQRLLEALESLRDRRERDSEAG